ncbi:hypothetical protein LCGC14_2742760 [marine sediment metagenome]|uniref:Uncharacterized protein n=1 Tax=marine sediment metagenome TaxID=412755 RepID=A0A0F8Z407_9ZZZZ
MTQTKKRLHEPDMVDSLWMYVLLGLAIVVAVIFGAGFFFGMVVCNG